MVKHIVLFNVKEGVDAAEVAAIAASVLEPLVGKIRGLTHVEVRKTYAGTDFHGKNPGFNSRGSP